MLSAVSGRDAFCSTGETAAVVSMLTGHKNYLYKPQCVSQLACCACCSGLG